MRRQETSSSDEDDLKFYPRFPGLENYTDSSNNSSTLPIVPRIRINREELSRFDGAMLDPTFDDDYISDDEYSSSSAGEPRRKRNERNIIIPESPEEPEADIEITNKTDGFIRINNNIKCFEEVRALDKSSDIQNFKEANNITVTPQAIDSPKNKLLLGDLTHSECSNDFSPATDCTDYIYSSDETSSSTGKMVKRKLKRNTVLSLIRPTLEPRLQKDDTINSEDVAENFEDVGTTSVVEEKDHNKEQKRKRIWNRKNACVFCEKLVTNFTRHLQRHRSNEQEVIKYYSINDADLKTRKKNRQTITDSLRNRGNFLYNSKVCFEKKGILLPNRRKIVNDNPDSPSNFVTCKTCLGIFKRATFYRHFKKCGEHTLNKNLLDSYNLRVLATQSLSIMTNLSGASVDLEKKILPRLRNDDISIVVRQDPLILAFGSRLLKKKKERRSRKAICSKLRDLANLLIILRNEDSEICQLRDAINPKKYETFIIAVKKMCGFNEETGDVKVTSIPARIRPSLLGCIEILYTETIMNPNVTTTHKQHVKNILDEFKLLLEANWQWEISSNAEKTRKRNLMTKAQVLPLDEDIEKVMTKIHELEAKYPIELKKDLTILNYENLCEVTIAHIILLDRKRSGDAVEAELKYYINRKTDEIPQQVLNFLTPKEQKAINELDVFQIPGKRVRSVPVLLTKTMRENIDILISCRELLNIPFTNQYLFARPLTDGTFDGGKCLNRIKDMCQLKNARMLTATGMRHHIATMSQVHTKQNDQYTEHLAGFLGHDLSVHSKNYRLPLQVLQKGVVGSRLMEIEGHEDSNLEDMNTNNHQKENIFRKNYDDNKKQIHELSDVCRKTKKKHLKKRDCLSVEDRISKSALPEDIEKENVKDTENNDIKNRNVSQITTRRKQTKKWNVITEKSEDEVSMESKNSSESMEKDYQKEKKVTRRKKSYVRWTDEEMKVVKKHFKEDITKKTNPGKAKCTYALKTEPLLYRRTWEQLNTCVNNIYKRK